MVKVKVCGITSLKDAEAALELGADLLGFNFYAPSPRWIDPEEATRIIVRLPDSSCNVALFVNESRSRVREVIARGKLSAGRQGYACLQFHGEESADYCINWELKVIKAFRLKTKTSLHELPSFPADYFLLDSWSAGYGGSGTLFPWDWLDDLNAENVILSGGLTVENVAQAVRRIRPYAVDVCSGVESRPGVKDYEKLKQFIIAAKGA